MKIDKNTVVSLTYTLRKDNESGEVIEVCSASRPLEFVFERGEMLAQFESNIKGLEVDSTFAFALTPEQAYGAANPEAVVELSQDIFVVEGVLREDLLIVGNIIPMRDNSGNPLNGKVVKVDNDAKIVVLDFNHPLADTQLYFTGKIEAIREATEDEVAYGLNRGGGCGCGDGGCGSGSCDDGSCGSGCDDETEGGCGSGCGCK